MSHVSCGPLPYRSWMKWKRGIRSPWQSSTHSCRASERQPSLLLGRPSPSRASSPTQALRWVSKLDKTPPDCRGRVPGAPLVTVLPFTRNSQAGTGAWLELLAAELKVKPQCSDPPNLMLTRTYLLFKPPRLLFIINKSGKLRLLVLEWPLPPAAKLPLFPITSLIFRCLSYISTLWPPPVFFLSHIPTPESPPMPQWGCYCFKTLSRQSSK